MAFTELNIAKMRLSMSSLLGPFSWTCVLLALFLGRGLSPVGAYSSENLITWMQASNFGLQVLQYALNDTESTTGNEAVCLREVQALLSAAGAQALPALRGKPPIPCRFLSRL